MTAEDRASQPSRVPSNTEGTNVHPLIPQGTIGSDRFIPEVLRPHLNHTFEELRGKVGDITIEILEEYAKGRDVEPSALIAKIIEDYLVDEQSLSRIHKALEIDLAGPTFNKVVRGFGVPIVNRLEAAKRARLSAVADLKEGTLTAVTVTRQDTPQDDQPDVRQMDSSDVIQVTNEDYTEENTLFRQQVEQGSRILEEPLMPPSMRESLYKLPFDEVKRGYPFRLGLLTRLLESEAQARNISEDREKELKRLKVLNALDKYIEEYYQASEEPKVLRPVQIKAFEAIRNHLEQGETDGYIKLPTGIGKTVIFTEFLKAINGTGVKSLVAVPTQDLMRQTKGRFEEFGSEDLDVGMVYQYAREHGKEVTLITYASLIEEVKTGAIKPDEFDVFIGDEIHESLGKGAIPAVNKFKGGIRLGFTATPKYSENKQVSNLLNHEIYAMTVREAIEQGLLSSVSVVVIKTNADLSNVSIKSNGQYNIDQLDEAINTAPRNKAAIRFYEQNLLGQVALARCNTINHAANLARQFNESVEFKQAGLKAAYIHSKMDPDLRKELIRQHQAGEIHVLCHAGLLKRGYDNDKISAVFRMSPAYSIVDVEQEDGRGTRLNPNNPDKHLYVVEMRDQQAQDVNIVSYAQILNGTVVYPLIINEGEYEPNRPTYPMAPIVPIDVEGFEVVTNEQEILSLINYRRQKNNLEQSPDEYLSINRLVHILRKSEEWIKNRIPTVISSIKQEWDESSISEKDRPILYREYKSPGRQNTSFSPLILERLKEEAQKSTPPSDWLPKGDKNYSNTLAGELNVSTTWITTHLPHVIHTIKMQRSEAGIPLDQQEPLSVYYDSQSGSTLFYAPIVLHELKKLRVDIHKIVNVELNVEFEGFLLGKKDIPGTLAGELNHTREWIQSRLPKAFAFIKQKWDEQDIPDKESELLTKKRPRKRGGGSADLYSPIVLEALKMIAEQEQNKH